MDAATASATDLVQANNLLLQDPRYRGWLSFEAEGGVQVIFIGEAEGEVVGLYYVFVPDNGGPYLAMPEAMPEAPVTETFSLADDVKQMWHARQLAIASSWPRHDVSYNFEVIVMPTGPDETEEYWVAILPASTDPDLMLLSGHVWVMIPKVTTPPWPDEPRGVLPSSSTLLTMSRTALPHSGDGDLTLGANFRHRSFRRTVFHGFQVFEGRELASREHDRCALFAGGGCLPPHALGACRA